MSEAVSRAFSCQFGIPVICEDDAFGCDKSNGLLLYDTDGDGRRGVMRNQGIKNSADYPYSIAIYRIKRMRDIVSQIHSDYFKHFERNLSQWGYPWGRVRGGHQFNPMRFGVLRKFGITQTPSCFHSWLSAAKHNESCLFLMACPDYPFDSRLGRYTNEALLGDGIGLVAEKSLAFLREFSALARQEGLLVRAIIGVADYEDEPDNLLRLSETEASFAEKISTTIEKIRFASQAVDFPVTVVGIRDMFPCWNQEWAVSYAEVARHLFALPSHVLARKIKARSKLYSRWLPGISDYSVCAKMIRQGAEYATCGALFSANFSNLLVIGTNSIDMTDFYQVRAPQLPVLCVARVFD